MVNHTTKLTAERQARIVQLLSAGNYRETAAEASGISSRSLREWLRRGDAGEEPFAAFAAEVRKAEAEVEVGNVATILTLGKGREGRPGDWRALAWWLEKRHRRRYGQQVTINVEETKDQLLQAVGAVCARHPEGEAIFHAILDELESGSSAVATSGDEFTDQH